MKFLNADSFFVGSLKFTHLSMGYILNTRKKHLSGLKQTDKNDCNLGCIFYYVKKVMNNLVPRASVVEPEVERPEISFANIMIDLVM